MDFDAADLEAMGVADLKAFIANNGGTAQGLLYKNELVAMAKELLLTPSPASAAPAAPTLPPPSPLNPYKLVVPGMERACEGIYLMEDW